ncbi:MAG: hypothetical protein U1F36_23345 [Planctomycetota bacterium]
MRISSISLSIALTAGACIGQHELAVVRGDNSHDQVGFAIAGTANGWVFIGAPGDEAQGLTTDTGAVHVRSWSRLQGVILPVGPIPLAGSSAGAQFGYSLAEGDPAVPGQVVIGEPAGDPPVGSNAGRVVVVPVAAGSPYPGQSAAEQSGYAVAAVGDVDGDGATDYLAGAPFLRISCNAGSADRGRYHLFSSNPALPSPLIVTRDGPGYCGGGPFQYYPTAWERLATHVCKLGDVNGDGLSDFLVGTGVGGKVYIDGLSPPNPPTIVTHLVVTGPGDFGAALCALGDVSRPANNTPDFAVGSPSTREVRVIDGGSGSVIRSFVAVSSALEFGAAIARVGDQDGDGLPDLLIGAPGEAGGRGSAYLFSVGTGDLLMVLNGPIPGGRFGQAVAGLADLTGDQKGEIAVGAPEADVGTTANPLPGAGFAAIYSLDDSLPNATRFGTGCVSSASSGPQPLIGMSDGRPKLGQDFRFSICRANPGSLGVLCVGFSSLPAPFDLSPVDPRMAGCSLWVQLDWTPAQPCASRTTSTVVGQGFAESGFTIPNSPSLQGVVIEGQWYDSNNAFGTVFPGTVTRALRVVIGSAP